MVFRTNIYALWKSKRKIRRLIILSKILEKGPNN
jgi:hypothetical protein